MANDLQFPGEVWDKANVPTVHMKWLARELDAAAIADQVSSIQLSPAQPSQAIALSQTPSGKETDVKQRGLHRGGLHRSVRRLSTMTAKQCKSAEQLYAIELAKTVNSSFAESMPPTFRMMTNWSVENHYMRRKQSPGGVTLRDKAYRFLDSPNSSTIATLFSALLLVLSALSILTLCLENGTETEAFHAALDDGTYANGSFEYVSNLR